MPDPIGSTLRNPITFLTSLAVACISVTTFFPVIGLNASITCLLYLYLKHEHRLNPSLVRRTPLSPENPLPSREEWIANEGLKKIQPLGLDSSIDGENCIVCRDVPNDPTQITLCGHIFCTECLNAWHERGQTSCPQCTISLWRDVPSDRSRLEKLVKITAAEGLVAGPVTLVALAIYVVHFFTAPTSQIGITQALFLVGFVLLSSGVLLFLSQGFWFMVQRRQEQGVKWWGGDLDAGHDQAWRMTLTVFSVVAGCWLLFTSLILEASGPIWRRVWRI